MTQESKGWFSEELNEAQKRAQQRSSSNKKGSSHSSPSSSQGTDFQKTSLRERILSAIQGLTDDKVQEKVSEAKEIRMDPSVVRAFIQLWRRVDSLALYKLSAIYPERDAQEKWFGAGLEAIKKLQEWASSDSEVNSLLMGLQPYNENPLLRDFLYGIVEKIERPLRKVDSFYALKAFLKELEEEGLVFSIINPSYYKEGAIQIQENGQTLVYLPRDIPLIKASWEFLKEAEERAKKNEEGIKNLEKEATLSPQDISKGSEGVLFLRMGPNKAVLLRIFKERGQTLISVYKSFNIPREELPEEPALWDFNNNKPQGTGSRWARIIRALEEWPRRQEKQDFADNRIRDLLRLTTLFPPRPLSRLFQGEKGVVAIWHKKFKDEEREGLFAIAIEGDGAGNYFLKDVVSSFPFLGSLIGERLPLEVVIDPTSERPPEVSLKKLPQMAHLKFRSLQLVVRLIRWRLKAEQGQ